MSDGIYLALSGAIAQTTQLESTATNLSNVSTVGYQRVRPVFREALDGTGQEGSTLRYGAVTTSTIDTTPGALRTTGRGLDAALPEKTYLTVSTPRGERYTRAVSLQPSASGVLQTASGATVLDEGGSPIAIKPNGGELKISESGEVWQGAARLGRLSLVTFPSAESLAPEGGTLLAPTQASGAATAAKGPLQVGALEESNASVIGSMTELVNASRTFEAFQRAIDAFHEADRKVVTTVAGVGG